jgi:hypothetical protein
MTSKASKMRDLAVDAARAAASKAGVDIDVAAAPNSGPLATVGDYLQLWGTLATLYYLDQGIKGVLVQVGGDGGGGGSRGRSAVWAARDGGQKTQEPAAVRFPPPTPPFPPPPPPQAGIKFPSALAGMFGVFAVLCLVGDKNADKILRFFNPALSWIAKWLPLFYVPALVTLPLALQGIPGAGGGGS